ncbi:MAG: hypothetical protein R3B92_04365 [Patescibacteria group bacterium]
MLTKEKIRQYLDKDPFWTPDEDASPEDWDLFEEVLAEMDSKKSKPKAAANFDEENGDDDDDFDGDDEDFDFDDDEDY